MACYGNSFTLFTLVHYYTHNSPPPVPIPIKKMQHITVQSYFFRIQFNVILDLPSGVFFLTIPLKPYTHLNFHARYILRPINFFFIIVISISSVALCWTLAASQFLNSIHSRTPWTGDQPFARPQRAKICLIPRGHCRRHWAAISYTKMRG
jgi:hypothetical protein